MKYIVKFLRKYPQSWTALFALFYFSYFNLLEREVTANYTVIETALDRRIPFCEYFVIPYILWFIFIAVTVVYFFFRDRHEFYQLFAMIALGGIVFLLTCTVFPNGQELRPAIDPDRNIFCKWVEHIYAKDTNTNVFPSMHVYNSIAAVITILSSRHLKGRKIFRAIKIFSVVLAVLICLSTMFIKQHSVIDVLGGIFLAFLTYILVYRVKWRKTEIEML